MTSSDETPEAPGAKIRILLADDHPIVLAGMSALLAESEGYTVVGQATDGEDAWALLNARAPDVAVVDARMPRLDGLGLIERARAANLETAFVLLTMYADPATYARAMDLDVEAYVLKDSAVDEVLIALDAVARGERYASADLERARRLAQGPPIGAEDAARMNALLTPTERLVLRHLSENRTSRQIATELGVSVRTVQNHRANVCEKLGLRGANKLLELALAHRLVFRGEG